MRTKKTVRIAELKTHLSAYLRAARRGQEIVIQDRDTPIARLVPMEEDREEPFVTIKPTISMEQAERMLKSRPKGPVIPPAEFDALWEDMQKDAFDKWLDGRLSSTPR
jgi:prevent-host-death family protein